MAGGVAIILIYMGYRYYQMRELKKKLAFEDWTNQEEGANSSIASKPTIYKNSNQSVFDPESSHDYAAEHRRKPSSEIRNSNLKNNPSIYEASPSALLAAANDEGSTPATTNPLQRYGSFKASNVAASAKGTMRRSSKPAGAVDEKEEEKKSRVVVVVTILRRHQQRGQ